MQYNTILYNDHKFNSRSGKKSSYVEPTGQEINNDVVDWVNWIMTSSFTYMVINFI